MSTPLGMDAVLYGSATRQTSVATGMTIIEETKDVTIDMSTATADVTTRSNKGWRQTKATLKECTIQFELLGDTGAEYTLLEKAFLNGTDICAAALTRAAAEGGRGPLGMFSVTDFSRSEPLEDAVSTSVTLSLTEFIAWVGQQGG